MLSRMAESLYWIGRYVERAEQTARLTEATFRPHARDGLDAGGRGAPRPPLGRPARHRRRAPGLPARHAASDEESVSGPPDLLGRERQLDRRVHRAGARQRAHDAPSGGDGDVGGAQPLPSRRAAAGTPPRAPPPAPSSTTRFCRSIVDFSQLLQGITDSTMPREEGWYFLQAGKFLERAEWTARTLDVNYRLLVGDDAEQAGSLARWPRRPTIRSRGARCCARCPPTSRTTGSRAGASSRAP